MRPRFAKLSVFYFFYFAILGAYTPYWPLYLYDLGYSPREIGELMAIPLVTKVIAPYLWGWFSDYTRQRLRVIQVSAFLSMLCFSIIFISTGYWFIALAVTLFSFFWNALLPQVEVLTLDSLRHQSHHYSRIRLWGSIGFIVAVLSASVLVGLWGSAVMPAVVFAILVLLWLTGVSLTPTADTRKDEQDLPIGSLWDRAVIVLLLVSCLLQMSHGPYYAYFTLYMESHGYHADLIGVLWAFGVVCEILVLLWVSSLLKKYSIPTLLAGVAIITAGRWLFIANFPETLSVIVFAQALHAVSFGVYHATMMHALSLRLPPALKGRGQALYSSIGFGVGGGVGIYIASILWEGAGAMVVYTLAAGVCLLATLIVIVFRKAFSTPYQTVLSQKAG